MSCYAAIVANYFSSPLRLYATRAIFTPLQDPAQEHMLFVWTGHCVRACARLRPDDVCDVKAGPPANNPFFAPFITGAPACYIKAVEIHSGHITRNAAR